MTCTVKHHDGIPDERWRDGEQREIVISGPRDTPESGAGQHPASPAGAAMTALNPAEASGTVGPYKAPTASVAVARARPAAVLTVLVVCVALLPTGCSGRQTTQRFNAATAMRGALRYVACVRSHGVPNMPDPQAFHSGGKTGVVIPDPGPASTSSQFKSAQRACQALQAGPAVSNTLQTASSSAQRREQALAFAVCMRSHRVSRFPDPNGEGVFTAKLDASAPQVQAANHACQRILPTGADPLSGGWVPAP